MYWVVTDHPNHPKTLREDGVDHSVYYNREDAQRLADAWNRYGGEWTWYVREIVVLPASQPALFDF